MGSILRPEIERRLRAGERQVDIHRALGVSHAYVSIIAGLIDCRRKGMSVSSARWKVGHSKREIGRMISSLPEETLLWLVAETPPGATVADTLRGIIADAYFEAVQA